MIKSKRVNVTDSATLLTGESDTDRVTGRSSRARNEGDVSVFVGGADVTVAQGWEVAPGDEIGSDLLSGDKLYAIAAVPGPTVVSVIQVGI